jgi:hypothetical protein
MGILSLILTVTVKDILPSLGNDGINDKYFRNEE